MSTRLFFGHLARGTSQRHLESFISDFGDVREVAVVDRFGFVDFRNPRDAADAVRELNGKNFRGERVIVEYARSRGGQRDRRDVRRGPPARSKYRIIVENVSSRATWKDLKDHMRRAGEVCFADVHRERSGEGIVEYDRHDDFKYAFTKLQDSEFFGKKICLVDDYRPSRRGRSGSRSPRPERNRSPRRGRSRSFSPRRERNHSRSPRRDREDSRRESRRSRSPQRNPRRSDSRSLSPKRQSTRSRRSISRSQSPKAYRSGSHTPEHGDSSHVTGFKNGSGESPKNSEGECTPPPPRNDSVSPDDSVQPNGIDSQVHDDSVAVDMA